MRVPVLLWRARAAREWIAVGIAAARRVGLRWHDTVVRGIPRCSCRTGNRCILQACRLGSAIAGTAAEQAVRRHPLDWLSTGQ